MVAQVSQFYVGLSHAFDNKAFRPGYSDSAYGDSFVPTAVTPRELMAHVLSGNSITAARFKGNTRRDETFISMQLIALDLEAPDQGDVSVADVLGSPFVRAYALAVFPSPSSGKVTKKNPHGYKRTRALFLLSEAVEGVERARTIVQATSEATGLPWIDPHSFKPTQPAHGSTNSIEAPYINYKAVLPVKVVGELTYERALEEMLRALQPKRSLARPVGLGGERYAEAAREGILQDYRSVRAHAGLRHDAFIRMTVTLIARKKGGWPGFGSIETDIRLAGQETERTHGEIESAIRWAEQKAEAKPFQLPDRVRADISETSANPVLALDTQSFEAGLPRSWLDAILQAFPGNRSVPKLALLLFEAPRQKLLDAEDFTFRELMAARDRLGIRLTDASVRASMDRTEGLFWNLNKEQKGSSDSKITSRGGRPEQHFRMRTPAEIRSELPRWMEKRIEESRFQEWDAIPNLTDEMIATLEGEAQRAALEIASGQGPENEKTRRTAYFARVAFGRFVRALDDLRPVSIPLTCEDVRAALLAVDNDPNEARSFRQIARDYGTSPGTVSGLVQRAALEVEKQYTQVSLTAGEDLEQQVRQACKEYGGYPRLLVETQSNGEVIEHIYAPGDRKHLLQLAEAQASGSSMEIRIQTASKYRPIEPGQQRPAPVRKPSLRHRRRHTRIAKAITPYYGPGYNPTVVLYWLKQHLRRLGWRERADGWWISADGEKFGLHQESLFAAARRLGAVITKIA